MASNPNPSVRISGHTKACFSNGFHGFDVLSIDMVEVGFRIWAPNIRKWFKLSRKLAGRVSLGSLVDLYNELASQNPDDASCGILSKTKAESVPQELRNWTI